VAHDIPFVQVGNPTLLKKSHTFTLEPGIYVEGVMGARIEHNLVFDGTRAQTLDTCTTDLWCVN
jgi:Xaa-Pro dipeptidase